MLSNTTMIQVINEAKPGTLNNLLLMGNCAQTTKLQVGNRFHDKVIKKFLKRTKHNLPEPTKPQAVGLLDVLNDLCNMETLQALGGLGGSRPDSVRQILAEHGLVGVWREDND